MYASVLKHDERLHYFKIYFWPREFSLNHFKIEKIVRNIFGTNYFLVRLNFWYECFLVQLLNIFGLSSFRVWQSSLYQCLKVISRDREEIFVRIQSRPFQKDLNRPILRAIRFCLNKENLKKLKNRNLILWTIYKFKEKVAEFQV